MANTRSARKRIRSNERKHIRNRAVRSAVRTRITGARRALLGADVEVDVEERLRSAISALDRAAEKGILHRKNAARRKSRLVIMANRLLGAAGGAEQTAARATAAGGAKGRTTRAGAGRAKTGAKAAAKPAAKSASTPAAKAAAARVAAAKGTATAKPKAGETEAPAPRKTATRSRTKKS